MTYTLTCPGDNCGIVFKHEAEPEALAEGGELITCPECGEEWAWELAEDGTLELLPDEDDPDDFERDEDDQEDDDEEEDDLA
jgi:hypothetical protein